MSAPIIIVTFEPAEAARELGAIAALCDATSHSPEDIRRLVGCAQRARHAVVPDDRRLESALYDVGERAHVKWAFRCPPPSQQELEEVAVRCERNAQQIGAGVDRAILEGLAAGYRFRAAELSEQAGA